MDVQYIVVLSTRVMFILPIIVWCGGARVRLPFAMENKHETKTSNKFTRMQLKNPGSLPKKVLFRQPAQNPKTKKKQMHIKFAKS